jgi:hypothetical protein
MCFTKARKKRRSSATLATPQEPVCYYVRILLFKALASLQYREQSPNGLVADPMFGRIVHHCLEHDFNVRRTQSLRSCPNLLEQNIECVQSVAPARLDLEKAFDQSLWIHWDYYFDQLDDRSISSVRPLVISRSMAV